MAKRKPQDDQAAIDGRSPDVVLEYAGGRTPRFVPARDLSGGDLARIAYRRAALAERSARSTKVRPGETAPAPRRPAAATPDELADLAAALTAGGVFVRLTASVTPATSDQDAGPGPADPGEPTTVDAPAPPADQEA